MRNNTYIPRNNFNSTFLSADKDQETILRKLFVENKPYSDMLKKLLIINTKDCLDPNKKQYQTIVDKFSLKDLLDDQYIRVSPKLEFLEHEEVKSYIIIEFDDYIPTSNPEFRDCVVCFSIFSHLDHWELDDYSIRPRKIAGYIDGILNNSKMSGIGTLQFLGMNQVILSKDLGGVMLRYLATHGSDDYIPDDESDDESEE